ncbi:D-alanine--poly(phosphoribitol) ligase subunit DltA [Bacillus sp. FJAT-49736]|uniref:D-alanine--poly(phosphoribitol) ligase subunit DltA n=1 Tax=Bacillus sp. FJAT-49736 TaxID=2833582 RepID=UPI001BC92D4D|nr:D-alanine--poly(phosphoribitol) ligase subunit DltA [Bacillus sp. FJAT-49736]MBS4175320.1 D-alanine--poly(phosphoribitol) ligase subunit DltA [Bacillus sp. FJAT-49736]
MNIIKSVQQLAVMYPDRSAFINRDDSVTYGELWDQSNRLATYIKKHAEQQRSPIIVYGHMAPEMVISFLGSVKAGHPYIPVDVSIPIDRVKRILESSKAEFFLVTEEIESSYFESYPIKMIQSEELHHILSRHTDEASEENWVKEEDTFYIIYTSGSTGNPKGVQITTNNLHSYVKWMLEDFPIEEHRVFLNQAPFSFDLSVMDLYPSLCTGGTLLAITKDMIANPKLLFEELKRSNIHVWTSTPSFAQMCLMEPSFTNEMLPNLEVFLFCGEVLSAEVARQLKERFPRARVFNLYGPTEATVAITMVEVTDKLLAEHSILPIGFCKRDTRLLIVDEDGKQLPEGEKGEMIIVGPSVSIGYLGEKELTNKSFFIKDGERAYKTGDAGFEKNGLFYYQGRLDFQVKVHGYRMELEEIEYNIAKSQFVEACVVVPVYKDGKVDYLSAMIVPGKHSFEKEYQLTGAIKKELSKLLPAYMVPRKFSYTHSLPMTPNGKVDRKKLSAEVMA